MEFLWGFICCWILLGIYTIIGLDFDWQDREVFWEVLCLPLMPFIWLWDKLR